eukprot:gene12453-6204_t
MKRKLIERSINKNIEDGENIVIQENKPQKYFKPLQPYDIQVETPAYFSTFLDVKCDVVILVYPKNSMPELNAQIKTMLPFDHKNIAKCLVCFDTEKEFWVVFEDFNLENHLFQKIEKKSLPEEEIAWIAFRLLQALSYLKTKSLIHRDIKCVHIRKIER